MTLRELMEAHPDWLDYEVVIYQRTGEHRPVLYQGLYQPNDEEWADQREYDGQPKPAPVVVLYDH